VGKGRPRIRSASLALFQIGTVPVLAAPYLMSHPLLYSLLTSTSSTTYVSKGPSLATQFTNVHALPPLLTSPRFFGINWSFPRCLVAVHKRYAIPNHPTSRALNFTHNLLGFVSFAGCLHHCWYPYPRPRVHHVSLCLFCLIHGISYSYLTSSIGSINEYTMSHREKGATLTMPDRAMSGVPSLSYLPC